MSSIERYYPCIGFKKARYQVQKRGLSSTVISNQHEYFPFCNPEIHFKIEVPQPFFDINF